MSERKRPELVAAYFSGAGTRLDVESAARSAAFSDGSRRKPGRKPQPNSARNGGVRVVGIVSPDEADSIAQACERAGITRGELLVMAAYDILGTVDGKAHTKGKAR